MIYYHVRVNYRPGTRQEFHTMWVKESLPLWEKYGAKHIGSWHSFIGADNNNQVVRIFAFDDMAALEKFMTSLYEDEVGRALMARLDEYITSAHVEILLPVDYSPLK